MFFAQDSRPPPNTDSLNGVFGTIAPVGPITGDPIAGLSKLLVFGIRLFLFASALAVLAYLLWGTFDWIVSGGDKEKVSKAQQRMTYAVFGMVIIIVVFAVFGVLAGDILGVLHRDAQGNWIFIVPTFNASP